VSQANRRKKNRTSGGKSGHQKIGGFEVLLFLTQLRNIKPDRIGPAINLNTPKTLAPISRDEADRVRHSLIFI